MLRLIQELDPESFEHVVLCPPETDGILEELSACKNCRIEPMGFRSFKNLGNLWKLKKLVEQGAFDLIHSHGKAAGLYSRLVGAITGVPVIHQLHGIHYKHYPKPLQYVYRKVETYLSRLSRLVVCVSESEKKEGLSMGIATPSQSVVVRNGVDTSQFQNNAALKEALKQEWEIPRDARVIISITRLCFQKNPELTLKIHAKLCRKHPDAFLFLVGIPSNTPSLSKLAHKLGIANRVIMTDNQSDMHKLLNIGDVYINNSRWEGMSLGLIEAMSMRLPVVISKVVGNEEMLNGQFHGAFFVEDMSAEKYAFHIEQLLTNDYLLEDCGKMAREHIKEHYSLTENVNAIEQHYTRIASEALYLKAALNEARATK